MIKDLKEQILKELETKKADLAERIKKLLSLDNIIVDLNEDFSNIMVNIFVSKENKGLIANTKYVFNYAETINDETKEIEPHNLYSGATTNLILSGNNVVGSYTSDAPIETNVILAVFQTILAFKQEQEAPAEEAKAE